MTAEKFGSLAESVYKHKYAQVRGDGTRETWPEVAERVARAVCAGDDLLAHAVYRRIAARQFLPGGRYLYAVGRPYPQVNNCLGGDTRVLTDAGVATLRDLAGSSFRVLNRHGVWEDATCRSFGVQRLFRVRFANGQTVLATADHRWWQTDGSRVPTTELTVVPLNRHAVMPAINEEAVRHGIIFGDGHLSRNRRRSQVRLCGKKQSLVEFFPDDEASVAVGGGAVVTYKRRRAVKTGPFVSLYPPEYKSLPESFTPDYARGFIAGLIATDGSVSKGGSVQISCEGLERAWRIAEVATAGGCEVTSVRVVSTVSPFDGSPRELCLVGIRPWSAPIVRPDQVASMRSKSRRTGRYEVAVEAVEDTGRDEEVFCCVVPGSESFTLASGVVTSNCALLKAYDSRQGWAGLLGRCVNMLMTGMGVGVVYSDVRERGARVGGMGGQASGPCSLMQMVNEAGRHIMQGGSRRSAVWAGLHWHHPDVFDFVGLKNWPQWMADLKATDFNAAATMDGTNISVILDDAFFHAYHSPSHRRHSHARQVYAAVVRQMLTTGEPGFSIDVGEHAGEHLRNAPVVADTRVLTRWGYLRVRDLLDARTEVWTGKRWATTQFRRTAENAPTVRVTMTGGREVRCEPSHPFLVERYAGKGKGRTLERIDRVPAGELRPGDALHVSLPPQEDHLPLDPNAYALGFVYGDGSFTEAGGAEVTLCTPEKRRLLPVLRAADRFSSVTDPDARGYARVYFHADRAFWGGRSKSVCPENMGRAYAASFVAGLFDADGNWEPRQKRVRLSSNHPEFLRVVARYLESLGVLAHVSKNGTSTLGQKTCWQLVVAAEYVTAFADAVPTRRLKVDAAGYAAYRKSAVKVLAVEPSAPEDVYCCDVGVEEHSFQAEGVIISNCTEVTSRDDNDVCNLASLNLARFDSLGDFRAAVEEGTCFLLHGTVYSTLPTKELAAVRDKNRRLGLGLMGMHEWLLKRGKRYGPDAELAEWLAAYKEVSDATATREAARMGLAPPAGRRAVAPTGTIAIVAETTSGIEPVFATAFKRRYLKGTVWHSQYVIDSAAQRLIDQGVSPDAIEDAYTLAADPARRLDFQAFVQEYVDQGISSTLNLPAWGSDANNPDTLVGFADTLIDRLPLLRGVTAYPDGSRGGQPLTVVSYREAVRRQGVEFEEHGNEHACVSGVCGV